MSDRDDAIEALWRILAVGSQQPTALFDPLAVQAADRVRSVCELPADLDAADALGLFHFVRFMSMSGTDGDAEFMRAAELYESVYDREPDRVPPVLRAMIARHRGESTAAVEQGSARLPELSARVEQLMAGYSRTGSVEVLTEAIDLLRQGMRIAPPGDPTRISLAVNLSLALWMLSERTGASDALAEAADLGRAVVGATDPAHPSRPGRLSNLGLILRSLYERTERFEVLQEAVDVSRAAVAASSEGHPARRKSLSNLAVVLGRLVQHTGQHDVVQEAVQAARLSVAGVADDDADRGRLVANLSLALNILFHSTRSTEILEEAIAVGREAVALLPEDGPDSGKGQSNLSVMLWELFDRTGRTQTLDEAMATSRAGLRATAGDLPARVARTNQYVVTLLRAHQHTGRFDLLREAVEVGTSIVGELPSDHPNRAMCLGNLASTLIELYERTEDLDTLDEAIARYRQAAACVREDDANRPGFIVNLAAALGKRFDHTHDPDTLEAAREASEAALKMTPSDHPYRPRIAANHATYLHTLFFRENRPELLTEAISLLRSAVAGTPADHPERAHFLEGLGEALDTLADLRDQDADIFRQSREAFREALRMTSASLVVRIRCGRRLARLELRNGTKQAALAAIEEVAELYNVLAPGSLERADREHRLGLFNGLPGLAAAAALAAGRPERAVELLERTRGILVTEALGLRNGEHARLQSALPDLAARLDDARAALASFDRRDAQPSMATLSLDEPDAPEPAPPAGQLAEERGRAYADVQAALDQIRAEPGFEGFLRADASQLSQHARRGPIVLVNADPARSDALILRAGQPVLHVPLPDLMYMDAVTQTNRLLLDWRGALDPTGSKHRDAADEQQRLYVPHEDLRLVREAGRAGVRDLRPDEFARRVRHPDMLAWLWDVVAEPVLNALGHTAAVRDQVWPRVWWCPVGVMSFLPLHAAGHHDDAGDRRGGRRTVLDRVVSSYTPVVRALPPADESVAGSGEPQGIEALIVAVPDTPGAELPGVHYEGAALTALMPGAHLLENPTRRDVLDALTGKRIAHFACHGYADRNNPAASRLILADHASDPLTVADVATLDLDAELAYLSACSTGTPAPRLTDEIVHLTGAFQLAGYRQVVGTLWPVDDAVSAAVAADFYERLTTDKSNGREPNLHQAAEALHHAVRSLRDRRTAPMLWAAYIHTGA